MLHSGGRVVGPVGDFAHRVIGVGREGGDNLPRVAVGGETDRAAGRGVADRTEHAHRWAAAVSGQALPQIGKLAAAGNLSRAGEVGTLVQSVGAEGESGLASHFGGSNGHGRVVLVVGLGKRRQPSWRSTACNLAFARRRTAKTDSEAAEAACQRLRRQLPTPRQMPSIPSGRDCKVCPWF